MVVAVIEEIIAVGANIATKLDKLRKFASVILPAVEKPEVEPKPEADRCSVAWLFIGIITKQ